MLQEQSIQGGGGVDSTEHTKRKCARAQRTGAATHESLLQDRPVELRSTHMVAPVLFAHAVFAVTKQEASASLIQSNQTARSRLLVIFVIQQPSSLDVLF
jgi:hypothetical protein